MRLPYYKFLLFPAFISLCSTAEPGTVDSVDIIQKFIQDLESSPSGYTFNRHSDDVYPGGYDTDVKHGKAKIAARVGLERYSKTGSPTDDESRGMIQSFKSTGGYSFVISHDYGAEMEHAGAPSDADPHYGASNADFQNTRLTHLDGENYEGPNTDVREKSGATQTGETQGLDDYSEKEGYVEYDEAKDENIELSVHPEEYYGVDFNDGKEKYNTDDRYGDSNNSGDEGGYVELGKYYGSDGYQANRDYRSSKGQDIEVDKEQLGEYVFPEEYSEASDFSDGKDAGLFGSYRENVHSREYQSFKDNYDHPVNYDEDFGAPYAYMESSDHDTEPKFENINDWLMSDFFKDYNHFFHDANERTQNEKDLKHEHEYYSDHGFDDASSLYKEGGEAESDFSDDADHFGNYNEHGQGEKNSNFGQMKGHKKGSKTTGYHNVLHKDEYTKDHKFYDNARNNGHFDKGGNYDGHHFEHDEGHERGSNHDYNSSDDHHGETDSEHKGYFLEDKSSNNNEDDYGSHFDDNFDYSNKERDWYSTKYGESNDDSGFDSEY